MCAAALGTDTAASIRLPAAYCGIVGLKATYGLASIRGIVPSSETHDHLGLFARSVAEKALEEATAVTERRKKNSLRSRSLYNIVGQRGIAHGSFESDPTPVGSATRIVGCYVRWHLHVRAPTFTIFG